MTTAQDSSGAAPPRTGTNAKSMVSTGVGNALEWFDWSIYATFAPFFAARFFNPDDPIAAFLSTLAIFAVGFLARPAGGFLFGWLADRRGRKFTMCATVGLAAAGSLIIGLTPSYGSIGVAASLLLVVARLVQGLAHGGEMPAAQTYISETAPREHRGRWSSLIYVSGTAGSLAGLLLGAVLTASLSSSVMADYGWRIPFILGGLGGVVALLMRSRMHETEAFQKSSEEADSGDGSAQDGNSKRIWPDLIRYRKQAAQVIGLSVGPTVAFYIWTVATPGYAIAALHIDETAALLAGLFAGLLFIAVLPLWGALSDRVGRKPVLLASTLGTAVMIIPMDALVQDSGWQLFAAMAVVQLFLAGICAIVPAVLSELFPTRIRTVGVGMPYSIAVAVFGGTAPYLQTWMGDLGGRGLFNVYVIALLLVSTVVCARLPETRGRDMQDL